MTTGQLCGARGPLKMFQELSTGQQMTRPSREKRDVVPPTSDHEKFRAALKHILYGDPRINQKVLAAQAGISPAYLSRILSNPGKGSIRAYQKIARAVGYSLGDLLQLGARVLGEGHLGINGDHALGAERYAWFVGITSILTSLFLVVCLYTIWRFTGRRPPGGPGPPRSPASRPRPEVPSP